MEVTMIAAGIAALVLLIWASVKLNAYSEVTYGYTPIGWGTILWAMVSYVLLVAGFFIFKEDPANQTMAVILGSAASIALFWRIASQSSVEVAIGAIVLLAILGLLVFLILLAASGGRDRDDYYYYYDD